MVRVAVASKENPNNRRKKKIDTAALKACIEVLGYSKESFRLALEAFRNEERPGNNGPSYKTWRITLETGWASDDLYASILRFVRRCLGDEHGTGQLKCDDTPPPLSLDNWASAWDALKRPEDN